MTAWHTARPPGACLVEKREIHDQCHERWSNRWNDIEGLETCSFGRYWSRFDRIIKWAKITRTAEEFRHDKTGQ
jgi:hypothetical protein